MLLECEGLTVSPLSHQVGQPAAEGGAGEGKPAQAVPPGP